MSGSSTVVSRELFDYVAARTHAEDPFLKELKAAAIAAEIPAIWIAPEQGAFMEVLLRSAKPQLIVEVGTLAGYSAICMARALEDGGRLISLEVSEKHADFAREWISRSDVAGLIEVRQGRGVDLMPAIQAETVDVVFLDADKQSYALYLEEARRILRPGGLLLVDNAFAFGQLLDEACEDPSVEAIRAFNDKLAADPDFDGVIVPLGDGLWVARRLS
ncbi:MAG: O-methyltransferase [Planctomycetes bacterium]|nr:O-methyltransferase [Planctomycetota bacterium]